MPTNFLLERSEDQGFAGSVSMISSGQGKSTIHTVPRRHSRRDVATLTRSTSLFYTFHSPRVPRKVLVNLGRIPPTSVTLFRIGNEGRQSVDLGIAQALLDLLGGLGGSNVGIVDLFDGQTQVDRYMLALQDH